MTSVNVQNVFMLDFEDFKDNNYKIWMTEGQVQHLYMCLTDALTRTILSKTQTEEKTK